MTLQEAVRVLSEHEHLKRKDWRASERFDGSHYVWSEEAFVGILVREEFEAIAVAEMYLDIADQAKFIEDMDRAMEEAERRAIQGKDPEES